MPGDPPDLTWQTIIRQVLDRNNLTQSTAAVKIMAAGGEREIPPWDYTLVVTARPYVHRLTALKTEGLHVVTYPEPRQTPLADFKSLNYLFYYLAGRWAQENGAHEALILNPDGSVSETNTANILLIKGHTVLCPKSPHVLPGVMEAAISRHLTAWGYAVKRIKVWPEDVLDQDQVLLTNALMGAVPVLSLDGNSLPPPTDLSQRINADVIQ
jgi:para-aminobenzoate synthetase component 1